MIAAIVSAQMSELLPPVCILAGGLGSRLGPQVRETPKALLEVGGEPFLFHQLRLLAHHGARDVVLCVGYLADQVVSQIGDERFGIRIVYSHDGVRPLGTLGAIRGALPLLGPRFLVLYGDTYLQVDYRRAALMWTRSGLPAMMTVLRNERRWGTSNACFDGGLVTRYDKLTPPESMRWIDYGLGGLQASAISMVGDEVKDLADLYGTLARRRALYGYEATERFYEIGTPAALIETSAFLRKLSASSSSEGDGPS